MRLFHKHCDHTETKDALHFNIPRNHGPHVQMSLTPARRVEYNASKCCNCAHISFNNRYATAVDTGESVLIADVESLLLLSGICDSCKRNGIVGLIVASDSNFCMNCAPDWVPKTHVFAETLVNAK